MTTDKKIIEKLLKIASNQQKVIEKLAQMIQPEPAMDLNALYLKKSLAQVVGLNMGLNNVTVPEVETLSDGRYTVHIAGVPGNKRNHFGEMLMTQLKLQKPELANKITYLFV